MSLGYYEKKSRVGMGSFVGKKTTAHPSLIVYPIEPVYINYILYP